MPHAANEDETSLVGDTGTGKADVSGPGGGGEMGSERGIDADGSDASKVELNGRGVGAGAGAKEGTEVGGVEVSVESQEPLHTTPPAATTTTAQAQAQPSTTGSTLTIPTPPAPFPSPPKSASLPLLPSPPVPPTALNLPISPSAASSTAGPEVGVAGVSGGSGSAPASIPPASVPAAAPPVQSSSSPAPRRPPPPTKGILKPPPPPPKPTFGNRLRDLAANVVGTAPAVPHTAGGSIGGRGRFEPALQAQAQAQAQSQHQSQGQGQGQRGQARGIAGSGGGDDTGYSATSASPSQPIRPAEQRLQEVSAAVGGTLNALSGKIGLGFSRFVSAATTATATPSSSSSTSAPIISGGPSSGSNSSYTPAASSSPASAPASAVRSLFDSDTLSLARMSSASTSTSIATGAGTGSTTSVNADRDDRTLQKRALRRATFVLPSLSIVYPISTYGEPWSEKVAEERRRVESSHRSLISATTGAQYWTPHRLVLLYETACKGREERSRVGVVRALESLAPSPHPRTLHLVLRPFDLSTPSLPPPPYTLDTPLTRHAAEALADVLTIEWGLAELKLEGGMVEDEASLKSILHALLVSGTLGMLSLAGSRKIRAGGWRLVAVFLAKAQSLRYIDLSDTAWDKRGMEYVAQALSGSAPVAAPYGDLSHPRSCSTPAAAAADGRDVATSKKPSPEIGVNAYGSFLPPAPLLRNGEESGRPAAVQTLRMDGCNLRHNVLEVLANGVRTSGVKNLSLRRNRIGPLGGVSLAVMIRDYPDAPSSSSSSAASRPPGTFVSSSDEPRTAATSETGLNSYAVRSKDLPLPPHSAPNGRISPGLPDAIDGMFEHDRALQAGNGDTSTGPGVADTARKRPTAEERLAAATSSAMDSDMTSAMRRHVGRMDDVKRIGRLLTLDLKGNDIRSGVQYIAQVLKRNRTLKVLNLSDNRIDGAGLAVLAEALKYNRTLETLDLSSNPCCGYGSEGIYALRSALTINTSLKRLFLSDTGLTAEGAISIAECLPETRSLLHFDLTDNPIDLAGAIALSSGLRSNTVLRCLDVTVIASDPDMADASQAILQTCIRNTESAVAAATAKASGPAGGVNGAHDAAATRNVDALWLPVKKSTLVRQAKEADEHRAQQARINLATSTQGQAREFAYKLSPPRLVPAAERTGRDLEKWLDAGRIAKRPGWTGAWQPGQLPRDEFDVLVERAKVLKERLVDEAQRIPEEGANSAVSTQEANGGVPEARKTELSGMELLIRMIELKESLEAVLEDVKGFVPPPRLLLPSQIVAPPTATSSSPANGSHLGQGPPPHPIARHRRHVRGTSLEISSPNFSIGDSDNDSDADAEEVDMDMSRLASPPRHPAVPGLSKLRTHSELGSSSTTAAITSSSRTKLGGRSQSHQPLSASSSGSRGKDSRVSRIDTNPDTRLELAPGDETDAVMAALLEAANSPQEETERSRRWVEEEGEVFRKSTKLGVVQGETEGDKGALGEQADGMGKGKGKGKGTEAGLGMGGDGVSGEELKQEILDTEVARDHEPRVIALADDDDNDNIREAEKVK